MNTQKKKTQDRPKKGTTGKVRLPKKVALGKIRRYQIHPTVEALVLNIAESAEITLNFRPESAPDRFVIVLQKDLPTIS